MPVGAQAQIDCPTAIVEVAGINWIEEPVRPVRGGIGEESEVLSQAAAEGRRKVSGAKIAGAGADAAFDILINAGVRLNNNDAGIAPAEFSRDGSGDDSHRVDRICVERTGRNRVEPVGDRDAVKDV